MSLLDTHNYLYMGLCWILLINILKSSQTVLILRYRVVACPVESSMENTAVFVDLGESIAHFMKEVSIVFA